MSEASAEPRVVVYETPFCGFCRRAERLLDARGIPYEKRSAMEPGVREEMIAKTGWRTVPIILIDGELIGGYQELAALDRSGELRRRLS